jgi:predicted component of type VI protein secretion system
VFAHSTKLSKLKNQCNFDRILRAMNPQIKLRLRAALKDVSDLHVTLENVLDSSLMNSHIDVNPYIKLYNKYLTEVTSELEEDELFDVITPIKLYDYTGDDFTDVVHVKEKLLDVYLKVGQLMNYIENKLEFE